MTNFDNMDLKELEKHIDAAHNAREKKKKELKQEHKRQLDEFAKTLGTTVEEVYDIGGGGKKKTMSRTREVRYIDDQGKPFKRAMSGWTREQKNEYANNAKESVG